MGYSVSSLDELGDGYGFRKVRGPLGVKAFGVNVIVYPAGAEGVNHYHDTQDELYFVHSGTAKFGFEDGERIVEAGGLVHVEATTPRNVGNAGDGDLVLLIVGGAGGYVERDGHLVDPADLEKRKAMSRGDLPGVGSTEPGKERSAGSAGASREN
jgi:quercetin dioxygenase-like cupin family protein